MTMPFDPYATPGILVPRRASLVRPEYDLPADPMALPDAPVMAYGAPQDFSLAGPPVRPPPPPLPLVAQVGGGRGTAQDEAFEAADAAMSRASRGLAANAAASKAREEKAALGAGAGYVAPGETVPAGQSPLKAGTPTNLVPLAQPGAAAGGGRPAAPLGYDPQNPGRALTPAEVELDNLRRAAIQQELAKRASAGRWVPQQKLQTSEATQGLVGPDPVAFGRYVDARGYRADLDKQNADMEAGIAQRQTDAMATARGIEETARLQAERVEKEGQARAAAIRDQIGAMNEKVQGEGYDNMRLWNNASEGKKAGFLLAAALSGIGQAMMGRAGEPNSAIKTLLDLSDRDAERQKVNIANNRQKLNDLQKLYKDTLEQTGSEKAAISAVKIAKLEGLKGQVDTEAAMKRANQTTTKRMLDKDGNVVEWSVPLAAERTKAAIDERIAQEDMIMSREINGQVSRQYAIKQAGYQGGSSGPDLNKVLRLQEARGKMERDALESSSKLLPSGGKAGDGKAVFIDGKAINADPRSSQASVDKAQDRITYADDGLETVGAIRQRSKQAGAYLPGDPQGKLDAMTLAGALANASGSGVPSESDKLDAAAAVTPGPRQDEALKRVEQKFRNYKVSAVKRVGGLP